MKKRDIGNLMQTLIRERETPGAMGTSPAEARNELTTLGVPLVQKKDGQYVIDLTHIHVFRNLHTFTKLLTNEVLEQCGFGTADIMVRRKVDPHLTPELAQAGLDWVMIYARMDAAESLPFYHRHFDNCMQFIFRTLQTEQWGGVLFSEFFGRAAIESGATPPALLFPFHLHDQGNDTAGNYFLVEYSRAGRLLRITIENAVSSRLQLKHIPHRVVDHDVRQSYLSDVFQIAEQIHQGILHECMNNRTEYTEIAAHHQDLFCYLREGGLTTLQTLHFIWSTDDIQIFILEQREDPDRESASLQMLIKEIQLLEDPMILKKLACGEIIEMISGDYSVFLDLSRYGACLNVSFDVQRKVDTLSDYLDKMPALSEMVSRRKGAMKGVRLFLIHHITAEVIGLLKAFEETGCVAVTTFFVKYAGIVPEAYQETLMSLPPGYFRFYALQKIESRQSLTGRFALSRQFTPLTGLKDIEEAIFSEGHEFLGAMRLAAGHIFLKEIQIARDKGEKLILVEDGGYLAPMFNRFCLENRSLGEVFSHFRLVDPPETQSPFKEWLEDVFLGSVEHTRNGYDYNKDVEQEFGRLQFPVTSIAVSSLKRGPEARECAVAIINATENIFHRLGMLLSRRKILVLGSSGAIGHSLIDELRHRLDPSHLFGVDIAAVGEGDGAVIEAPTLDALDRKILRNIDTIIGVIGDSIIKQTHLEDILINGKNKAVYLISGSTKTVEFRQVEAALQMLRDDENATIACHPVKVEFKALRDLQTGVLQGYCVEVRFSEASLKNKDLYLLGELMPINFLYYGIPREIIDEVMAQLFQVSCGFVRRQRSPDRLPARLLAVDREIDADANIIHS